MPVYQKGMKDFATKKVFPGRENLEKPIGSEENDLGKSPREKIEKQENIRKFLISKKS
jgi:hypothetical protein